jgi:hypothetical protein
MEPVKPKHPDLFDSFSKDPFELAFFSANEPEKVKKMQSTEEMLENEFLAPTVPFSIVPGHHGGTTSAMSLYS